MNNLLKLSFVGLILAVLALYSPYTEAAVIKAITKQTTFGLDGEYRVEIIVDTEGKNINAIEGEVLFPKDLITLKSIEDGESIVGLWLNNPKEDIGINGNKVIFSGVIPNGYIGNNGLITTLIFSGEGVGKGVIQVSKGKVLVNDGTGATIPVFLPKLNFTVDSKIKLSTETAVIDITPPDEFGIQILRGGPELYDGKYFIIFNTYDRESGIDHYEKYESVNPLSESEIGSIPQSNWTRISNPAVVSDQTLKSYVYIKVLDRQGNQRISTINPNSVHLSTDSQYSLLKISVIMVLCIVAVVICVKIVRNRKGLIN